jgi:hypothetical protein
MADDEPKEKSLGTLIRDLLKRTESREPSLAKELPAALPAELWKRLVEERQKEAAETGYVDNELANNWFAEHWPEPRICPICKQNNWALTPQFVHMSLGPMGPALRTRTYPCVSVVCRVCGHTVFFNAVIMNLLAKGEE